MEPARRGGGDAASGVRRVAERHGRSECELDVVVAVAMAVTVINFVVVIILPGP